MADLNDLGYKSISDMTTDEAIEHLRQIRLSRRIPVKKTKVTKRTTKKKVTPTADQAAELLAILTGGKK